MANLIQIPNCIGIDCSIGYAQEIVYDTLQLTWDASWNCYPRIYKNKKKSKDSDEEFFVPEFLLGNYEYTTDTLFDDTVDVVSYFLVGDIRPVNEGDLRANVSLVFSCLINRLYNVSQKADEQMHRDIIYALRQLPSSWTLNAMSTGVDEVYREFTKKELNYSDMSNRHLCRFDFELDYSIDC